jgi:hypothetical protein
MGGYVAHDAASFSDKVAPVAEATFHAHMDRKRGKTGWRDAQHKPVF